MNIADIGRAQLSNALSGKLSNCDVSEWLDTNGNPVKIYWKPLTGLEQKQIDGFDNSTDRTLMCVKVRALDAGGKHIFKDIPIESLRAQYDYAVMRAIGYLMAMDISNDVDETIEDIAKE